MHARVVDRDVAHRLVRDEHERGPSVERLPDQCGLDQRLCDAHAGRGSTIDAWSRGPTLRFFLELAAIPSPPGEERAVADAVLRYLRDLGLEPDEDGCGPEIGSTMGNIYARLEPTAEGTPLFFCAHLDTVPPSGPLEPVVEDGVVRNAGGTILGADNKSAVVAMLEGVRRVLAESRPHAGIELLFTPKEEVGLIGAYAFDHDRLRAELGYVYDQAAPIGEIILGAPYAQAHGGDASTAAPRTPGMFPEEGRSAIQAAASAIADLRLGRVDEETTANVGVDLRRHRREHRPRVVRVPRGGALPGRARSSTTSCRRCSTCFAFAATTRDCEVETESCARATAATASSATTTSSSSRRRRSTRCGYESTYALSGGAADANVFNERGRRCVNLANGMTDIHTSDERIAVADLDAMVDVTLALVEAARGALMEERRLGPVVGLGTWNTFGPTRSTRAQRRRRGARRGRPTLRLVTDVSRRRTVARRGARGSP